MIGKVKRLRTHLNISPAEMSSYINMSCYKYKKIECGDIPLPFEKLIIISGIFNIKMDWLVFDKYRIEDILSSDCIREFTSLNNKHQVMELFRSNLLDCNNLSDTKSYYCLIRNYLKLMSKTVSSSLFYFRTSRNLSIFDMAALLCISTTEYNSLESGILWPSTEQIVIVSNELSISIECLLKTKPE